MEEKSVFLEREGHCPKNKVLDFLIVAQDFDYSLKDIAKHSRISYPCMKLLKKGLLREKWIIFTRSVGKAQMHKLNMGNKKVQKFVDFYWEVVDEEVDKRLGLGKAGSHYSGAAALPVSAKGI